MPEAGAPRTGMTPRSKREYLRELVADKNRWSGLTLTEAERKLGFLGWHERGYLPHCDFPGLVQFATFRLADSMPAARRREWEHLLAIEDLREKRTKLEAYLDRGVGACWLRQPRVATLAIRYIESNPVKAKLCRAAEEWQFRSARFRDEDRRLKPPEKRPRACWRNHFATRNVSHVV